MRVSFKFHLLKLVGSVRQGACLELLCERGYSQLKSSGVCEAVSGYILYICLGSELWAEAIICCCAVAVGRSNILVWANAVAVAVYR